MKTETTKTETTYIVDRLNKCKTHLRDYLSDFWLKNRQEFRGLSAGGLRNSIIEVLVEWYREAIAYNRLDADGYMETNFYALQAKTNTSCLENIKAHFFGLFRKGQEIVSPIYVKHGLISIKENGKKYGCKSYLIKLHPDLIAFNAGFKEDFLAKYEKVADQAKQVVQEWKEKAAQKASKEAKIWKEKLEELHALLKESAMEWQVIKRNFDSYIKSYFSEKGFLEGLQLFLKKTRLDFELDYNSS